MDHYRLSDDLRKQLLESAAWGKAGIEARLDEAVQEETVEEVVEEEVVEENSQNSEELSEEVHVCPLCTSVLEEALEEEQIQEHLSIVLGLVDRLSQINEGEEDIEDVIVNALSELLSEEDWGKKGS